MSIIVDMNELLQKFETRVAIVGVGLIGGSIAAAIRKRFPDCDVIGVGRSRQRLQAAQDAGILTGWETKLSAQMLQSPLLVVVCLPVNLIADSVADIAENAGPETLITDAGSVKSDIYTRLSGNKTALARFVGAHPIAGGEQGGFEHADAELFEDRVCVLVQNDKTEQPAASSIERAASFWKAIGCRISRMTAEEHDRVLALTSHLPHIMAAVTTSVVGVNNLPMTGSGFRDTTRIASGDAALWKEILLGNPTQVLSAIDSASALLADYKRGLENRDGQLIEDLLRDASKCRASLT